MARWIIDHSKSWSAACRVAESWTYNDDRTLDVHTDFRGNEWTTGWSSCCAGRVTSQTDPLGAARTTGYDKAGNVTHTQTLHDTTVYNQTTTRYDARHRPAARTVWLVEQASVDEQDPPIAGGGQQGDPALEISGVKQGLTTRWLYDEDLADAAGSVCQVAHI